MNEATHYLTTVSPAEILKLLKDIEWSNWDDPEEGPCCPICFRGRDKRVRRMKPESGPKAHHMVGLGHAPGCRLAAAIAELGRG